MGRKTYWYIRRVLSEDTVLGDHTTYRYLTADEMKSLGDDSLPIDVTRDERIDSNRLPTTANGEPPQHIEDAISPEHVGRNYVEYVRKCDNVDNIGVHPVNIGFLVSFLVDARGGAMRGRRASGVRVIVPPRCAASPTRVTCRYVRAHRASHHPAAPPLMEGEALASRVIEMGPVGAKFLGPVIIEVPHFAALRGKEREIVILRSDNGESWKEHTVEATEEVLNEVLHDSFEAEDLSQLEDVSSGRITRIVTQDFPQYFAVVSRVRQEVHAIGPEGGMVSSTVVPQVQAVFPEGALTKKIKVGLQAQPIDPELTAKLLGHGVAVSPVVTVEPRRRKFHKAITLSMPAPRAHSQGMINQYSGSAPTLRLLCSITGGTTRAQWEDVTGSTPLTFVNDCVSFTTTVSARFWLMDCRNIGDATKMATELYREAIHVPFMAKFVVFAKRVDPLEARLRVFCMTDDKEDKTLEHQEHFTEVAKSRDVEVLEGKPQYVEFAGNLVPVTKSGDQLSLPFRAFRENRLPFSVRVKDPHAEAVGRCLFMKEPKVPKGEPPQQPVCILNIVLPEEIVMDTLSLPDMESLRRNTFITENFDYYRPDPRLADMSNLLGEDWVPLANQLGLTASEINVIKSEYPDSVAKQAQSMLRMWLSSQSGNKAQTNTLENALRRIGREDIIPQCLNPDHQQVTRIREEKQEIVYRLKGDAEKRVLKEQEEGSRKIIDDQAEAEKRGKKDKYSAEEKVIESPEEEEEEPFDKPVAERREKIEKRLSAERTIPASSQRREIVQEITTIKQERLVEDKIAEVQQKVQEQSRTEETTKTTTTTTTKVSPETGKTITKTVETVKATVPPTSTVLVTGETTTSTVTTVESRTTQPEQRISTTTHKVSEDTHLLEGVTESFEKVRRAGPKLIADEEPRSPKVSKTPPPSPADFLNKEQTTTIQEWETTKQEIKSPALGGAAAQKGKTTTTTQQVPIVDKPLSPTLNGLSTYMSKPKAIFDQTTALIESESRGEPYHPHTETHYFVEEAKLTSPDASKDDKKKKKGILGTIKNIVGKSFDSDSDSEKSPRKERRDKKQRKKPTGKDAPPEAPARPPRKPKSPTLTLERKYENIPFVETIPSAANDERETYVTSITIPVTDLDDSRTYVNTEIADTAKPVVSRKKETVIVQETFTKTIQPLRIEENEFTIIVDPTQKDKEEVGYEEVASPPVRPPRHKAHVYEDISEPLADVKKSTADMIESEVTDRLDREDKSTFEDKTSDSQRTKRKYGKLFGLFGKSKDVEESDDDSSRAEVIEKHDKETSKEDTSVVPKSEEKKSPKTKLSLREKDDKTFLGIFKKKQEKPAFSDAVIKDMIDSTAFLKEEVEKYHDVKPVAAGPKAQLVISESFTDVVSTNSETIIPVSEDQAITITTEKVEIQPVIQEVTTVEVTEKVEHSTVSETSPRHTKGDGKGSFLGLFKKKGSEEPDSQDIIRRQDFLKTQTETDSFLKCEVFNYHDVQPAVQESVTDKEKPVLIKEMITMKEDKPVAEYSKKDEKAGFLGLFRKKVHEEPETEAATRSEQLVKTQMETNRFLEDEVNNYHDVRPLIKATVNGTEESGKPVVTKEETISKEEKTTQEATKKDGKGGFLNIFKKKSPEIVDTQEVLLTNEFRKLKGDADSFLKTEVSYYHDVKPEAKEKVLPSEKPVVMKEIVVMRAENTVTETTGKAESKSKEEGKHPELYESLETRKGTDKFLKDEIDKYHDVKPITPKETVAEKYHSTELKEEKLSPKKTKKEGKKGLLGLFTKKDSEKSSTDKSDETEFMKVMEDTNSFLQKELEEYHDVRQPIDEVQKETGNYLEDKDKSPLVYKETIIIKEEYPQDQGKEKEKEAAIKIRTATDSFLENEVNKYHDVRPTAIERPMPFEEDVHKGVSLVQEIKEEKKQKSPKKTKKESDKGRFLGMFKKSKDEANDHHKSEEPRQDDSDFVKLRIDTFEFLKGEVDKHHDVRPIIKENVTETREPIVKEVTVIREEKPSPKKTGKEEEKGGILNLFKKKGSEEKELKRRSLERETKEDAGYKMDRRIREDTNSFLKDEVARYHDVRPVIKEKPTFTEETTIDSVVIMEQVEQSPKKSKKDEEKTGILGFFKKKGSEDKELKRRSMEKELQQKLEHEDNIEIRESTNRFLVYEIEKFDDVRPITGETAADIEPHLKKTEASEIQKEEHSLKKSIKDEGKGGILRIFKKKGSEETEMKQEDEAEHEENLKIRQNTEEFLEKEVEKFHDVRPMTTETSDASETESLAKRTGVQEEMGRKDEEKSGILSFFKKRGSEEKELKRRSLEREAKSVHAQNVNIRQNTNKFLEDEIIRYHDVKPVITKELVEEAVVKEKVSPKKSRKVEKGGISGIFRKKESVDRELEEKPIDDSEEAIKVIQETDSFLKKEVDRHDDVRPIIKETVAGNEIHKVTEEPVFLKETIIIKEETSSGTKTKTKVSKLESEVTEGLTKVKEETDKVVKSDGEEQVLWEEKVSKEERGGFLNLFKKKEHDSKEKHQKDEAQIEIRKRTNAFLQDEIKSYHDVKPSTAAPPRTETDTVQDTVHAEGSKALTGKKEKDRGGFLGLFKKKGYEDMQETEQDRREKEHQMKIRSDTGTFLSEEVDRFHDVRPIVNKRVVEEVIEKYEAKPVIVKETTIEQISPEVVKKRAKDDVASPKPAKKDGKVIFGLFGSKSHEEAERDKELQAEQLAKIRRETDTFLKDEVARYHDVRPVIKESVIEKAMQEPVVCKETMVLKEEGSTMSPKPKKRERKRILGLFEKKGSEGRETVCKKDDNLEELIKVKQATGSFLKEEIDKYSDTRSAIRDEASKEPEKKPIIVKETVLLREAREDSVSPRSKKRHSKGLLGLFEKKGSEDKEIKTNEEIEQLIKIRNETDNFLKDELDKHHDVKPVVQEQHVEKSVPTASVSKETVTLIEGTASPEAKKRESRGVFGIFAKKDVKGVVSKDTTESEELSRIRKDTDTFLKGEVDRYHDVMPAAEGNFTEEHVGRDTLAPVAAEVGTLSPKSKKKDSKGILGWFSKKGSEEKDIVDPTEVQKLLKLRQDTDRFLKGEIDKFHDVKPIIEENVVMKKAEEPKEKPTIIKETIVIKEDTAPSLSRDKDNLVVESDDLTEVRKDTNTFLENEIDKFHDVRPVKKDTTDSGKVTEGSISRVLEEPVIMKETIVIRDEGQTAKKEKTKDGKDKFLHIFKKKSHSVDPVDHLEHEKEVNTRIETDAFLKTEVDTFHDVRPIVQDEVGETVETKVQSFETTPKKQENKGGILGFFTKKDSEQKGIGDDVAHVESLKLQKDTSQFLKEEIDRHHDVKPIPADNTIQSKSFEKTDTKEAHTRGLSPEKVKRGESGFLSMFKKKPTDDGDIVDFKIDEKFEKSKSQTDTFLKREVDNYLDAEPAVRIIEEKITIELEQPMVLEKTMIITEQQTPSKLKQLPEHQEASADRVLSEVKLHTDKFLKEEVDRYDDVRDVSTSEVPVTKQEDEDSGKGGFFGFFRKKGSEDREIKEKEKNIDPLLRDGLDTRRDEKSLEAPVKESEKVTIMQQEKTSPKKGRRDDAKGIFGIFKKKGSEEKETGVQERTLEKEQTDGAKRESDRFIKGEIERYHDVRPTFIEKTDKEETAVTKDITVVKEADVVTESEAERSHDNATLSQDITVEGCETVEDSKKESPKPTRKEYGKGGLFGIFKKKDHKGSISKDEAEENAKIRKETDTFLQDEINKYHDVHQVTSERTADDSKAEKHVEKGVLSGLIKKGGGTDKEMEDKKKVAFKEDLEETQTGQMKRTEHLAPQETTIGNTLDERERERDVSDEDFMTLTPGQVDSLKEIEIHRVTEDTIRVKEGTAIIKTESIAISSPEKKAVCEDTQKNTTKTEDLQSPLFDRVAKQMTDTSDFLREEVARYEDARPIIRPTEVSAKVEEHPAKGAKLFGLFSKKKSQDEPAEKEKTKPKKKKEEEQEATAAAFESKDFSQKEVDRFHVKESKESGGGFFGLFSKKTKPQEKNAKCDSDGSQALSTQTLQIMKDSSDFLQNEVALYHDVKYIPDKVLTDIEIFEPIIMSPIDISKRTLQDINECNKFIHEEVDGIPEDILKKIGAPKEDDHTLESPTRTITYTTKVESIPHGERTTRVSDEVITGTIQLGPEVLSDLTKLEDEINKKLEQIRKDTSTKDSHRMSGESASDISKQADSVQSTRSEQNDRSSQEKPSQFKESEEQMFTKSGSPFKIFGRKISEEEVKRLQEEEHSIPGTYKVKDEDQIEENAIKISDECLKKIQDTQNFLSAELDNYESGKPEIITDLDDEIEKSKPSGLFSIFSKKDVSPKPTKKKAKRQKLGKRDESLAEEDSKKTGKSVGGILGKISEKMTGKTEVQKREDVNGRTSRESSLEKKQTLKDTAQVIKSLEDIQSTVQMTCDETSSFAEELIEKFEDTLDKSHSEIEKQSESFKKTVDKKFSDTVKLGEGITNGNEQKIKSGKDELEKEVDEIKKGIGGTSDHIEKKARGGVENFGRTIEKDAVGAEAAVASSIQNVEDAVESARVNLQDNLKTLQMDTREARDELKEGVEEALTKMTDDVKTGEKGVAIIRKEIEETERESKGFLDKLNKKLESTFYSTSKVAEETATTATKKAGQATRKVKDDAKELSKGANDSTIVARAEEAIIDAPGGVKDLASQVSKTVEEELDESVRETEIKQKEFESDVQKEVEETKKKSRGFLGKLSKRIESAVSSTTKSVDDALTSTEVKVQRGIKEVPEGVTKSASQAEKDIKSKFGEAHDVVKDKVAAESEELNEKIQKIEENSVKAAKEADEKQKEFESAIQGDVDMTKKKGKGFLDKLSKKIESAVSGTVKVVEGTASSKDTEIQGTIKASNNEFERHSKDTRNLGETTQEQIKATEDSSSKSFESVEEGVEDIAKGITDFATETKKEIEDRGRQSSKAIRGQITAAEVEIQKSMSKVDEAVEQIKKDAQCNTKETEETKKKGKGFLGKITRKLSGKKDSSVEETEQMKQSSDTTIAKGESLEKTGISGKTDQIPSIKTDESVRKLMSHSNEQHIFREPAMSDIKQRTIDFIESESLKVDDTKMTRTLSDYGCQMKEQQRIPGARKISEVNMDLSNLPTDAEDFSPLSDKAHSYVSSPTSARRTHSVHFSKTERPEIVELRDNITQESIEDEFYIITEPREIITRVTSEIKSKKPLFHIESEEDDSLSKSEDDRRDSSKSNVLETLTEQKLETLLSDMTRSMEEPIEKVQSVIKKEEKKLMEHKIEAEADVDAIEKKLRDLDTALDSLEQIQTKTETVTIIDTKTERKLKRVERKFERMASEVLEKEKTDAKQKQMTSPEVEARQETEYRELVSQLSTEEITDFQKEYSHLWDEHTFSKSSDWESKTPDSQADVQDLPKGGEVAASSSASASVSARDTTTSGKAEGEEGLEKEEAGRDSSRKVADQHQLSDEMKELLKELEKESKQ